ncbi:hypothetical protein AC1031_021904 [Aphanomyces cochlioides]|nr:hypothetical protein AC1031_021904 [Aphanomyces cochlioides]
MSTTTTCKPLPPALKEPTLNETHIEDEGNDTESTSSSPSPRRRRPLTLPTPYGHSHSFGMTMPSSSWHASRDKRN